MRARLASADVKVVAIDRGRRKRRFGLDDGQLAVDGLEGADLINSRL